MSVSGTYFPPKAPNRPAASGRGVEAEWGLALVSAGDAAAADTAADEFDAPAFGRIVFSLALAERRDEDDEGCAVASTTSDDGDEVTRRAAIAESGREVRERRKRRIQAGRCEGKKSTLSSTAFFFFFFFFSAERAKRIEKHPPLSFLSRLS
jgi:hypothetical protein